MRRFLVLLLLLITVAVTGTPAAAQVSGCDVAEQVYAVTYSGDLIVQPYCVRPSSGYLPPRTLASFGGELPQLFYGGQLGDNTVVIYGVGVDGTLRWYRESGATRTLEPGVVVGSQFGDWRNYQHLQTAAGGDLSGVDAQGRLWRWTHTGWRTGADTWAVQVPEDLGPQCPGAQPVFVGHGGPDRYVGLVAGAPPRYVYCGHGDQARLASVLPAQMEAVTAAAGPGVTYALSRAERRLTRMVLDFTTAPASWRADSAARAPYAAIFTGCSIVAHGSPPLYKYEWQFAWYGEYP